MKKEIKLTRNIVLDGSHRAAGSIVTVDGALAVQLIAIGKAERVEEDKTADKNPAPEKKQKPAGQGLTTKSAGAVVSGKTKGKK